MCLLTLSEAGENASVGHNAWAQYPALSVGMIVDYAVADLDEGKIFLFSAMNLFLLA